MKKRGKRYNETLNLIEKSKLYTKEEAVKLVKETSNAKFDATIEVAIKVSKSNQFSFSIFSTISTSPT